MSDQDEGGYDLADLPEKPEPKAPPKTVQPLPRLWKTEQDQDDEEELKAAAEAKKKKEAADEAALEKTRAAEARQRAKKVKPKETRKPLSGNDGEKKVLVEETPALDTYEARQRGRLVIGLLIGSCFAIFGYIFYSLFIYDPNPIIANSGEEPPSPPSVMPPPKKDLEPEARSLFARAQETAKAKQTDKAIDLLKTLVKTYPGTKAAGEASLALERPRQNMPLFLDRPAMQAAAVPKPAPPAPAQPTQVVNAQPRQTAGNASLTLPANPAEPTLAPTQSSPLAMNTSTPGVPRTPTVTRSLPSGFTARADAGVHSSGWPLVIAGNRDGAAMVLVPGGVFTMGNDDGSPAEAPAHKVSLSTYYIDQHEVTRHQFHLFLSEAHYRGQPPRSWSEELRQATSESLPMVMVNARDAKAYSEWALKQLPSEAQWEMAARSTDSRLFPWGSEPIKSSHPRSTGQLAPVMSVDDDVSPYGVHDLGGNVLEWTSDWYDSKYYHQLFNTPVANPAGPSTKPRSLELVVKGDRKTGSASARQGIMLEKRLTYVGFRCVLPVEDKTAPVIPGAPTAGRPGAPPPRQNTPPVSSEPF